MQNVPLSWLAQQPKSIARVVSGIVADTTSYAPPEGLLIAGFGFTGKVVDLPTGGKDVECQEELVDTVISWSMLGSNAKTELEKVECVLELDYKQELPYESIAKLSAQGDFSIALIGWDGSDSTREAYLSALKKCAAETLKIPAFSKRLYPFSLVFEWIFLEHMGKSEEVDRIKKQLAGGLINVMHPAGARLEYGLRHAHLGMKGLEAACREVLVDFYGSEEAVGSLCKSIAKPIVKRIQGFAEEVKIQNKPKVYRYQVGEQPVNNVSKEDIQKATEGQRQELQE